MAPLGQAYIQPHNYASGLWKSFFPAGWSAIDVGCGSGILSIALKLLGASSVLAIDNDPVAVRECTENARANRVELEVLCVTPEEIESFFDFLVANLEIEVFRHCMPKILSLFNRMGVFSGIYKRKELKEFIKMVEGCQAQVKDIRSKDDWFVVLLEKPVF